MTKTLFTWDLGATKCAAGLIEYQPEQQRFQCLKRCSIKLSDTVSLTDLINHIETVLDFSMADADAICIGGAGIYDGEFLSLEGAYPYAMPFAMLARERSWPPFAVIHDYAPIVCSTFTSYMDNPSYIKRLNDCPLQPYGRRVAIGVGTGLGLKDGVLLPNGDFWLGQNEAGHIGISLPPATNTADRQRHFELMQFLSQDQAPPVTFQKILSGQGTVRLQQFFDPNTSILSPEEVGQAMRAGSMPATSKAFAWYLGLFIGTMQLTFMPEGGIWLAGGVTLQHLEAFDCPDFHQAIEASPAYLQQRSHYPLGILCDQNHALIGGAYYAVKRLL